MSIIEQRINKNKEVFNVHEPDQGHMDRFQKKLKELHKDEKVEVPVRKLKFNFALRIAATVIFIFSISFVLFYFSGTQNQSFANEMGKELFDVHQYYASANQQKYREIDQLAGDDLEAMTLKERSLRKITKLEENTNELQKEYVNGNKDKRVFSAIVQNYKMLSGALDKVINNMNEYHNKKSNN